MKRSIMSFWVIVGAAGLAGCDGGSTDAMGETDVFTDDMPDDLPAGNCGEDGSGGNCETDGESAGGADSTAASVDSDCMVDGCMGQGVCAADWDMDEEARGEFECRFACIPLLDDSSWCGDDDSCCDDGARCTERGYCVLDEGGGSDTDGGSGTDTDGGSGTTGG